MMPAVCVCESCLAKTAHGVCCDVATSVDGLITAKLSGGIPIGFSAHGGNPVADARLGVTSMINNPRHNLEMLPSGTDALQYVCDTVFECELGSSVLCSSATW
jgi:hypothetical protein